MITATIPLPSDIHQTRLGAILKAMGGIPKVLADEPDKPYLALQITCRDGHSMCRFVPANITAEVQPEPQDLVCNGVLLLDTRLGIELDDLYSRLVFQLAEGMVVILEMQSNDLPRQTRIVTATPGDLRRLS